MIIHTVHADVPGGARIVRGGANNLRALSRALDVPSESAPEVPAFGQGFVDYTDIVRVKEIFSIS